MKEHNNLKIKYKKYFHKCLNVSTKIIINNTNKKKKITNNIIVIIIIILIN